MGKGKNVTNGVYSSPWEVELVITLAVYLVQAPLNRGRESSPKGRIQGHTAREQQNQGPAQTSSPF